MAETAVIYARQSFSHEADSTSIQIQIDKCRAWATAHGVSVIGVYSDQNVSSELYPDTPEGREAASSDRAYQRWQASQLTKGRARYKAGLGTAFDRIDSDRPTYLIVYTSNRLGRTVTGSNLANFLHGFLIERNCSIVEAMTGSVTDFSDSVMRVFADMRNALDYIGLRQKREASLASIHRRIDSFRVVTKAYGTVTAKGVIGFAPDASEVIRHVFQSVAGGASYASVLHDLNTRYRGLALGRQWYQSNITHILSNLVYCGMARDRQGRIQKAVNIPDPVIGYPLWIAANEAAKRKRTNGGKYNLAGHKRRHWLPLSGYLKCHCGRRMTVVLDHGSVTYRCINGGEHVCRIVTSHINHGQDMIRSLQSLLAVRLLDSRRELMASRDIDAEAASLEAEIANAERELMAKFRMADSLAMTEVFAGELKSMGDALTAKRNRLTEVRARQQAGLAGLEAQLEEDWADMMDGRLAEDDYQRLLAETVNEIAVTDDEVTVSLCDGHKAVIPRLLVDGRGKRVFPWSEVRADTDEDGTLAGICHYSIVFHTGGEARTLVRGDGYDIVLDR